MNSSLSTAAFEFTWKGSNYSFTVAEDQWQRRNGVFAAVQVPGCQEYPMVFVKLLNQAGYSFMRKIAGLTCEGIPRILKTGILDDGRHFVISEHVDAVPLSELTETSIAAIEQSKRTDELFRKICRTVLDVCRSLSEIGLFYRDLTPANVLISKDRAKAWLIDLDSCCRMGDLLSTTGFDQRFTLRYPKKIRESTASFLSRAINVFAGANWKSASAAQAQLATLAFAAFLWRIRNLLIRNEISSALQQLRSTSTKDDSFLAAISSPTEDNFLEIFGRRPGRMFKPEKIQTLLKMATARSSGDWSQCKDALNVMMQSACHEFCSRELLSLAGDWEVLFLGIGAQSSARDVLRQWPRELDETVRGRDFPELQEAFADRDALKEGVEAEEQLRALCEELRTTKSWVVREDTSRRLVSGEFDGQVGLLHHRCANAAVVRQSIQEERIWCERFLRMMEAVQRAWKLVAAGGIQQAMKETLMYRDDTTMNEYPPLADLLQSDQWRDIPWYQASLSLRVFELRSSRRFESICRLSQLFPDAWSKPHTVMEALAIREESATYLAEGRKFRRQGRIEEARQCIRRAQQIVVDCPRVCLEAIVLSGVDN